MHYLETENIVKQYNTHLALDKVSIQADCGKIYGLLGPNGAGKTTLIRIINGITMPDSGMVYLDGRAMNALDIVGIGYLPEERGLYKKMKVAEQAIYLARLRGVSKADAQKRLRYWFDKFDIWNWADKKLEELSKGMQQKVQFIITVLHEPKLLIFDEPFSGFDPVNARLIRNEILHLKEKGATILFSTHNMASVEEICDDIGLINKSHLVLQGPIEEIKNRYRKGIYQIKARLPEKPEEALFFLQNHRAFSLEALSREAYYWQWTIRKNASAEDHPSLLAETARFFDIVSFEEIIPDMNEIFIQTVQES